MNDIYQSLVAVNPVTLIAQICNLFLQLFIAKRFFLDKIKAVLDQRREAADRQIADARTARAEALEIRQICEADMQGAKAQANEILVHAQKTAAIRSDQIIGQAQAQAARIREKASADIAREKKKAIRDAKDEISGISVAIAEKVVGRQLTAGDQQKLITEFLAGLGDAL